jgi:hypothetical protein
VDNLLKAAARFGAAGPPEYERMFREDPPLDLPPDDEFGLSVADQALAKLVPELLDAAEECVGPDLLPSAGQEVERIQARFEQVVPAENCARIADILNAAWRAFHFEGLWDDIPNVKKRKDKVLRELVLKNLEVFQIEQILKEPSDDPQE